MLKNQRNVGIYLVITKTEPSAGFGGGLIVRYFGDQLVTSPLLLPSLKLTVSSPLKINAWKIKVPFLGPRLFSTCRFIRASIGAPQPHLQLVAHLVAITVVFVRCQEKDKGKDEVEELRRLVSAPTQAVGYPKFAAVGAPEKLPSETFKRKPDNLSLGVIVFIKGDGSENFGGCRFFSCFSLPQKKIIPRS